MNGIEPRLLDRVEHDHVVKIRDAQPDRDIQHGLTLVMDYLAGGSVHSALQGGHRFGVRRALVLVGHILDALDHLHAKHGFLHRDVKPGNVLLDESRETAYLGDLGSAAPLSDDDRTCEAHGGTLLYRPPEYGTGILDVRSDIYSLGVTLLEMLRGPFPYEEMDPLQMEERLGRGRRAFPDRFAEFPPCVNDQVRRAVRALVSQNQSSRPASAMDALRRLQQCKTIDWKVGGPRDTAPDQWEGAGLPGRDGKVRSYRVEVVSLSGGPNRGRFRVRSLYRDRDGGNWRRLVPDSVADLGDREALDRAFAAADKDAFQR
ncbi:serine/threonine-protein kinase [Micromonospora craniellae]|uniref:Serine/threonine protein kinase n=1 Tax=Micromonospora craniellae TaxID=2294034 RepID=A0A372FQE8_9ACTN|nr:serine/threonine-protein kinase [Micromonospora craniellae]QOC94918.1 serine/threonine protein kinase [Micromonospora craniellae]RFS39326.1 serine/threonine protein kinase [Micromonospora craniellae]